MPEVDLQTYVLESPRGRVVVMDSAYHVDGRNTGRDVAVNASYCGVLPARFIGQQRPRAAIGVDCGIGKEAAGIMGLAYLEALGIPAAVADVMTVELGNGVDLYESGRISRLNILAEECGVTAGMPVQEAAALLLERDPPEREPGERTRRTVMETSPTGRQLICTDSVAFGLPEDRDRNVLCTAGHTGRSALPYLLEVRPWGFICSDGGRGKNDSGMAALWLAEPHGLAGATVDAQTARMGDGFSTYFDGVISACNTPARLRGVQIGQPAQEAARRLLQEEAAGER